jgi:hypothetical protein
VEVMQRLETDKLPKEMDSLEVTFRRLSTLLDQVSDYVDGVVVSPTPLPSRFSSQFSVRFGRSARVVTPPFSPVREERP